MIISIHLDRVSLIPALYFTLSLMAPEKNDIYLSGLSIYAVSS